MYVRVAPYRLVRTRKARSDWLIIGAAAYTGESEAKSSVTRILCSLMGGRKLAVVESRSSDIMIRIGPGHCSAGLAWRVIEFEPGLRGQTVISLTSRPLLQDRRPVPRVLTQCWVGFMFTRFASEPDTLWVEMCDYLF